MATTSTLERPRPRATLTIPAENLDDFRVGVLSDLKSDAEGFGAQHAEMLGARDESWRSTCREDRDNRLRTISETHELLAQLPTEDVETTVTGTAEAFRCALEDAARQLVERVRVEADYGPLPAEDVLPLLDRLRWAVQQIVTVDAVA